MMTSLCNHDIISSSSLKTVSSENSFMSERSQAYILGNKLRKWKFFINQSTGSVCGETGEFSWRKGSGRAINLCLWSTTGNDAMIALWCHHDVTSC